MVGFAVGFGSQGLVQDVITGLTLIFTDTLEVGDMVEISGYVGRVVSANFLAAVRAGGPTRPEAAGAYTADRSSGATTMTIHGGHSLDAFVDTVRSFIA